VPARPSGGPVGRKGSPAVCLLALSFRAVPGAPVVGGANREEHHARPGDPPRLVSEPVRFVSGVDPGGRPEVRFYWRAVPRVLPAWHEGRLKLLPWGNRRGESRSLPVTGWASQQKVEGGGWSAWRPEPVLVPATAGFEGGVWFQVRQGVRGLWVRDEHDVPRVFLLCEPASHYYRVMTRGGWMPVLAGEVI
jgi:hypothetical protein